MNETYAYADNDVVLSSGILKHGGNSKTWAPGAQTNTPFNEHHFAERGMLRNVLVKARA